ncbi:ArsC family reductase [uncultured Thiocystis sp.]|jgi:Spx/MgsR family transcriptional regulator|uniref:ArsC family reductase n=1 Tax=uncultured Thiocystis sp. TaxID=1202134 RepID=UPI0025DA5C41|nr:ArsC family reductase [uncultured Thiocystis sp.]
MTLYGISNCDTVKQARRWLDGRGIDYVFHDYKKQGLDEVQLRAWVAELGWETLLNRRGTTWRKLPESVREGMDEARAIQVMLDTPSIIRRPLLDTGTARHVGFSETQYQELFR